MTHSLGVTVPACHYEPRIRCLPEAASARDQQREDEHHVSTAPDCIFDIINRHPDRFLLGTEEVAPSDQATYLRVFRQYEPFWQRLSPETRELVLKGNYVRRFDAARRRVRAWEAADGN